MLWWAGHGDVSVPLGSRTGILGGRLCVPSALSVDDSNIQGQGHQCCEGLVETRRKMALPSTNSTTLRDDVGLKEELTIATAHFHNELIMFDNTILETLSIEENQEIEKLLTT